MQLPESTARPAAMTHVLTFLDSQPEPKLRTAIRWLTGTPQWTGWILSTAAEYENGDPRLVDEMLLESARRKPFRFLLDWASRRTGYPVTLLPACSSGDSPVYWVLPEGAGNAEEQSKA